MEYNMTKQKDRHLSYWWDVYADRLSTLIEPYAYKRWPTRLKYEIRPVSASAVILPLPLPAEYEVTICKPTLGPLRWKGNAIKMGWAKQKNGGKKLCKTENSKYDLPKEGKELWQWKSRNDGNCLKGNRLGEQKLKYAMPTSLSLQASTKSTQ